MSGTRPKNAIITGGASGLGLEICRRLSVAGLQCIVFDRNKELLSSMPFEVAAYCVDVTDESAVLNAVQDAAEKYGAIDVLVNNAGSIVSCPVINLLDPSQRRHSYKTFKETTDLNLNSVFLVGSVVAECMVVRRTRGVIVNISSVSACGNAGQSAYSAAKAGVEALTNTWAKELGPFGIRSVAIAPGFMDTPSTRSALSEQKLADLAKMTPLRRLGSPGDVASGVLFAIECEFLTGTTIEIHGGIVL